MSREILQEEAVTDRIVSSVSALVQQIDVEPTTAHATFRASAHLNDGVLSNISIRNFNVVSDEPPVLGGTDKGPNPVELILGAFGACQEIVIAAYAAVLGIKIDSVNVDVRGNLDLRGFLNISPVRPGFSDIVYTTTIKTSETDKEKLDQLVYFALNRCPVLDILQNPVPVKGTFEFIH